MLGRTPEPELMDTPADAAEYDAMDHSGVNRQFVLDLIAACAIDGPVLDVGTGTADIPVILCEVCEAATVVAVDAAESMLAVARRKIESRDLAHRVTLRNVSATRLPFAGGAFAVAMSNSLLHHVADPRGVLAEMVRVTRPGGTVYLRDLFRPASVEDVEMLVGRHASTATDYQRELFRRSLHAAYTVSELRAFVAELGFPVETVTVTSDRHLTWSARRG